MAQLTMNQGHYPFSPDTEVENLDHAANMKLTSQMMHLLEKMERRQVLQDQRIAELHRQLVDSNLPGAGGFPQFPLLPPELRCCIWAMAIPHRRLQPFSRNLPPFEAQGNWRLAPPVISQVCRESRFVAYQRGDLQCLYHSWSDYWTWFDGSRDLLDLASNHAADERLTISGLGNVLGQARTLLIRKGAVNDAGFFALFRNHLFHQNVRTIYLQVGDAITVDSGWWHPHAVARLFAGDSFTFVELDDSVQMAWLQEIVEKNGQVHKSGNYNHTRQPARLGGLQDLKPVAREIAEFRQVILEAWLCRGGMTHLPASSEKPVIPASFPEMPRVELVLSLKRPSPAEEHEEMDHWSDLSDDDWRFLGQEDERG